MATTLKSEAEMNAPGGSPGDDSASPLERSNILIVDDRLDKRVVFRTILEELDQNIVTASSGEEALRWLLDNECAVILLDVNMPGMDGFEVARHLVSDPALREAVVMMLSSSGQSSESRRCRELGVSEYLTKPVESRDLLAAISRSLTRHRVPQSQGLPALMQPAAPPTRRARVLVAEDNVVNQRVAAGVLGKKGHEVVIAANGREALAAFDSREFDVVLMDVQMPDIDGFEVTARIRAREAERGGHVLIIAMTAHAMKGDRERCLVSGMDDYLCKPLDANLLLALIDSLKESRTLDSIPLAVSPVLKS
jgi:two-component system sensor histidine kinase/response regulator